MEEPRWLSRRTLDAMHHDLIEEHGGSYGARDDGLIDSALSRARNRWAYEPGADVAELAAAYGFGLAKNHGYVDGNKRIALAAMHVFAWINSFEIVVGEPEEVTVMLQVVDGTLPEPELAAWVRAHLQPRA